MKSNMLSYTIFALVVMLHVLSYWKYASVEKEAMQEQKAAFERYFLQDDDRLKMVGFSEDENTINIAIAIEGLGEDPQPISRLRENAQAYVYDKVCSSSALFDYLEQGNTISVDIQNEDAHHREKTGSIYAITMTANECS